MSEQNNIGNNKRIAKNTFALYIRMFFVMIVSLYTSRVVLHVLGEHDYGIYNVVGSVVVMFAFLSKTLAGASQRYFAFEIGRNNILRLKNIFSLTCILYLIIICVIVLFAETIGLWFVNNKMTIPDDRLFAANCVYQFSIISFCVSIIATPYQAIIIAREKMNVYAWVGILEALLHLLLVLVLEYFIHDVDYLIAYGVLMVVYIVICQLMYALYSQHKFDEAKFRFYWDIKLAKEMLSYAWWNVFGAVAQIFRSQGINLLISVFFVPSVNAARGIAYQINNAINVFANNFYTAVRPQVTKCYAQGNQISTFRLVNMSSKMTYYLLSFLAIPIFVFVQPILEVWLVTPPAYTGLFAKLVILTALVDSLSNPLMTLMQATGNVKLYQLITGGLVLLNLPISWIFLHFGYPAEFTMYVAIIMAVLCLVSRLWITKYLVHFPVIEYIREVISPVIITSLISYVICYAIFRYFYIPNEGALFLAISIIVSVFVSILILFSFGLSKSERTTCINVVLKKIKR